MFQKLAADGLLDYEKHRGAELTEHGEPIARELTWREYAVRTFFTVSLGTELDSDVSYRIGYVLPDTGIRRLHEFVTLTDRKQS